MRVQSFHLRRKRRRKKTSQPPRYRSVSISQTRSQQQPSNCSETEQRKALRTALCPCRLSGRRGGARLFSEIMLMPKDRTLSGRNHERDFMAVPGSFGKVRDTAAGGQGFLDVEITIVVCCGIVRRPARLQSRLSGFQPSSHALGDKLPGERGGTGLGTTTTWRGARPNSRTSNRAPGAQFVFEENETVVEQLGAWFSLRTVGLITQVRRAPCAASSSEINDSAFRLSSGRLPQAIRQTISASTAS